MVQAIERYIKQAIVDKSPAIASAALASAYHLMQVCPEVIRRWSNEIQEAVSTPRPMVQYHAIGLLYHIRQNDRLAILKLIQKLTQSPLRSNYANCLMVCLIFGLDLLLPLDSHCRQANRRRRHYASYCLV